MENSDSKPRFERTNHDGNRPNKPLQLRKKSDLNNSDRKSYNDNKRPVPYGNHENRPTDHPNRFSPNSRSSSYNGNDRYSSNDRYRNGGQNYGNNDRFGSEKRSYGGGERRNNNLGNSGYGSNGNDRGGNRPYTDRPKHFAKPRINNQDTARYDENNKKIVFRKRKNITEGQERKSFTPYKDEVDLTKPVRLNKFLANAGVSSRREADEYIQAGIISVNDQIITELGAKILPTDKVMFHGQPVRTERKIYLILNKPKDFVTTVEDTHERKTVMDLVKNSCSERIYPVGRLDRNTTGVLLFTNDGDLASRLTHPKYEKKKIYDVLLDKDLTDEDFNKILNEGIELEDGIIKADDLAFVKDGYKNKVGIEIHSGKNRIVRRLFDKLGYKVKALDRVYFAGLTKKNLPRGRYRFLTGKEISTLKMGAYE